MKLRCMSQVESGEVELSRLTYAKIEDKDGLKSQMSANLFQKSVPSVMMNRLRLYARLRRNWSQVPETGDKWVPDSKFQPFVGFWRYVRRSCCEALQPQRWESLWSQSRRRIEGIGGVRKIRESWRYSEVGKNLYWIRWYRLLIWTPPSRCSIRDSRPWAERMMRIANVIIHKNPIITQKLYRSVRLLL